MLWNVGESYLEHVIERGGEDVIAAEMRGYRGYKTDHAFLGKRDDSVMLRGSSSEAQEVYRRLYDGEERYTITRIDVQVTGRFDFDNESYGREAEAQALAAVATETRQRPRKVDSFRGNGRGDTCSIGSGSSDRSIRIYDKTREQRNQIEPNLWRWEIEYKRKLAQGVADLLAMQEGIAGAIVSIVATELQRKGVSVPWLVDTGIQVPVTGVSATNDGRRLVWLNTQVRPVLSGLIERVGLSAALVALGLEHLIPSE